MHIVIYASGIPFNGETVKEKSLGGSESAAYYVAKELASRGHRVIVFTEHPDATTTDGVSYLNVGVKDKVNPMGQNWHFYCTNTPHDVNIIQRVPHGFMFHIQSKINLWWAHDIALKRNNDAFMSGLWNVNRVLPVSNWFKEQLSDSWLIDPDIVTPIHNGVDYSLFEQFELKDNSLDDPPYGDADWDLGIEKPIILLYSSRPERGLENLVRPGGIMEQLLERAPHVRLIVCGYEHGVEALEVFYEGLREQVELLPNCEHRGALTKDELYKLMCEEADVWCYPTQFEEVSCITAMECMAAGLTIFTTPTAALPETLGDYENCVQIPNTDEGVNIDKFVERIASFNNKFRRRPRRDYTWERVTTEIEDVIADCFKENYSDVDAVVRHYLRNSDIVAIDHLEQELVPMPVATIFGQFIDELALYDFRHDQVNYAEHYAEGTEEMYDGPKFQYEEGFENHPRYLEVARQVAKLEPGATVVDYGCAHGHFTNNFAKQFPEISFIGLDVSPKAIEVATAKAIEWELKNVTFYTDDWLQDLGDPIDAELIILGEILEHVPDPVAFMNVVYANVGPIQCVITTPFGPWEEMSYVSDYPRRFHLHHMERGDLEDMFSDLYDFTISCLAAGHSNWGEVIGWYITNFTLDNEPCKPIDYARKYRQTVPRQTVSFCAIAKDAQYDLPRLLKSIEPYVDEIVIGVDETTSDSTRAVVTAFGQVLSKNNRSPFLPIKVVDIKSPVEVGFDAARNEVLELCTKHWVMWADADEEFVGGDRMPKYLRQNSWQGYGIAQHHFSVEPAGILSTDFPVRLFRRNRDVKFHGVVHEHPENIHKPNEGVGFAWVNRELHFGHTGYGMESVRRSRFERNISLMARDREQNPDRLLGRFLWIRDLALMNRFDLEQTQGKVTQQMAHRAAEGLKLWEETIDQYGDHPQTKRMMRDHLEYYDVLVNCMDQGFTFRIKCTSGNDVDAPQLDQVPELSARFLNKRHLDKFLSILIEDEVNGYEEKYI